MFCHLFQNSLALVNAAFRCPVDPQNNFTVTGQPVIAIGGISDSFVRWFYVYTLHLLLSYYHFEPF